MVKDLAWSLRIGKSNSKNKRRPIIVKFITVTMTAERFLIIKKD